MSFIAMQKQMKRIFLEIQVENEPTREAAIVILHDGFSATVVQNILSSFHLTRSWKLQLVNILKFFSD